MGLWDLTTCLIMFLIFIKCRIRGVLGGCTDYPGFLPMLMDMCWVWGREVLASEFHKIMTIQVRHNCSFLLKRSPGLE